MTTHDPIFIAPPITDIPDYVWDRRYDRPFYLPGKPVKRPKDNVLMDQLTREPGKVLTTATHKGCGNLFYADELE